MKEKNTSRQTKAAEKAGRPCCSLLDFYGSQSIFKLSEINSIFFFS